MHRIVALFALLGAQLWMFPARLTAQSAPPPAAAELAERVRTTVAREFGPHFNIVAKFQPMFGDFDGDGAEDLAVVVTGSPAVDQGGHNYKLIDPYDSFFGYGDAKLMMSFPTHPEQAVYVAIAHDWRAAHPKAKFVVVNLPFDRIEVSRAQWKKKVVSALFTTDSTGVQAEVFWDGKKYRWQAVGSQ
jgi:hypothetical protein